MGLRINPYIGFDGNAREAMEFYKSIFGGQLDISTFKEFNMAQDPADEDKVMHSMLVIEGGMALMGSDTPSSMKADTGQRVTISLSGEDHDQLQGYWDKLAEGGKVTMPFEKAPWGDTFGMLTDKFGVNWMVDAVVPQNQQ